jgi:hypothetical protein
MADDVWNLTPAEAGARLEAMKSAPPATDLAKPVNIAAMSSSQARDRLAALQADEKWTQHFLSGGKKEIDEFNNLTAKKNEAGDRQLEIAMRNGVEAAPLIPEVTFDGALNTAKLANVIADLRDHGLEDAHIEEAFDVENRTLPRAKHEAVKRLEQQRLGDAEYVKRYLSGGAAEKREMALIRIALGLKVAEEAA